MMLSIRAIRLRRRDYLWAGLALGAAAVLAGCESLSRQWEQQSIDASQSVIHFDHAGFDPQRAQFTRHHDPVSANDIYVAQFAGADAVAALAAYQTGPSFVVKERTTEAYVGDLLNKDARPVWGATGTVNTRIGSVPYRMFRIEGQPMSCVGFRQAHGTGGDDRGRKSGLLFGFFCQSDARPLSTADASDLISSVSVGAAR